MADITADVTADVTAHVTADVIELVGPDANADNWPIQSYGAAQTDENAFERP